MLRSKVASETIGLYEGHDSMGLLFELLKDICWKGFSARLQTKNILDSILFLLYTNDITGMEHMLSVRYCNTTL